MTQLSKYQEAIKDAFINTNQNIVVEACPGSGKTFTLLLLGKHTPIAKKSIFLAFNKSIAEELSFKLPSNIKAMTLHSLGMKNIAKRYGGGLKINENKTFWICRKKLNLSHINSEKERNSFVGELCKLYDLYRMNLLSSLEELPLLAINFDTNTSNTLMKSMEEVISIMNSYNESLRSGCLIDFTDMLYLCKDIPENYFDKYDLVFIDECQDLNPLQRMMVEKIKKPSTRQISVGDEKQCVYSFAGASLNSFKSFKSQPNTITLPLSVTYRCAKKVTEEANKVFPGMESFESNEEGEVRVGSYREIEDGDFVLCRNNKPLVRLYIKLLAEGKKSHIYGKDYGDQLIKLLDNCDCQSIQELHLKINDKRSNLVEELKARGVNNVDAHPRIVAFDEMYNILCVLIEYMDCTNVNVLMRTIMDIFTSSIKGITLMSCHKSKGLENKRVFLLDVHLIPNKYAQSKQMLYSEYCLKYVAITRAKQQLIYINSNEFEN